MSRHADLPRDEDGRLSAYAWPGGYPILYLTKDNAVLCPECVRMVELNPSEWGDDMTPVAYYIHYEGEPDQCEHCNKLTESAYGPVESEDGKKH